MKRAVGVVAFFGGLVLVWEIMVATGAWSRVLLPSPLSVILYLKHGLLDGTIPKAMLVTLQRLLLGYILGIMLGLPLGLLTARFRYFEDTLRLVALGLQTLPSVCWVPLAILWFGQTEGAMLFVVLMGTVWSILIAIDNGVRHVSPIYARAARTMGSRGIHTWTQVIMPASLPYVISGMKQGWAFAWRSLMAAEIFVTILTGYGLGQLLHYGREFQAMDQVLGVMLVITATGLAVDKLFFAPWERFLHKRWGTGQAT